MELDLAGLWTWFVEDFLPYSPPVGYTLLFAFAGQLSKRFVVNEANIRAAARTRDRLWNAGGPRRGLGALLKVALAVPLPVHPLAAAPVLAPLPIPMVPGLPDAYIPRALVLLLCALLSLGVYDLGHALLRRRGLDFKFPGEPSDPPPAPRRPRRVRDRAGHPFRLSVDDPVHLDDDDFDETD